MKLNTRTIRMRASHVLSRYRIARGFQTVEELCEAVKAQCGIELDPEGVQAIETGRRECAVDILIILAVFYDASIDDLVGFTRVPMAV